MKYFRPLLLAVAIVQVSLVVGPCDAAPVDSSPALLAFDVAAQRADKALTQFARQANVTLIFPYDLVQDLQANAVMGHYSPLQAVEQLLDGTGFRVVTGTNGYWRLEQITPASAPIVTLEALAVATAARGGEILSVEEAIAKQLIEEVVVTGIRNSLRRSRDIKRHATGIVDAISAEDIGKFPDSNLAESLQRITGVSIDRSNNEGNQVSVRGFGPTYNLVTLNGRQMPTSSTLIEQGINRSYNFREVSAESVAGVDVFKTPAASRPSGGIGATIDIVTAKPFDYVSQTGVVSLKAVSDTSAQKGQTVTPEMSLMLSSRFMDKRVGVLLALSHARRDSSRESIGSQGWPRNRGEDVDTSAINNTLNPSNTFWTPLTLDVDIHHHQRERQNGQLVLQFMPSDTLEATVDYTASRFREQITMNRSSFWFDTDVTGTTDSNGVVIDPYRANDELNFWAWYFLFETENDSVGFNVDWRPSDTFQLTLDYHDSVSHSQPNGETSELIINLKNPRVLDVDNNGSLDVGGVDIGLDVNYSARPRIFYDASDLDGGDPFAAENIEFDLFQARGYQVYNHIQQFQMNAQWQFDDRPFLTAIRQGLAYTDYDIQIHRRRNFEFVDIDITALPLTLRSTEGFGDLIGGAEGLFPYFIEYDAREAFSLVADAGHYSEDPSRLNTVSEATLSLFAALEWEAQLATMPLSGNIGVRWEQTEVISTDSRLDVLGFNYVNTAGPFEEVLSDDIVTKVGTNRYRQLLPNMDMKLELGPRWVGRLAYSVTNSRPDLSAMTPGGNYSVRRGGPAFSLEGNPQLLPLVSSNIDISLEWYYGDASYLSVGAFNKDVENFIGTEDSVAPKQNSLGAYLTDPSVNPRPGCPDERVDGNEACYSQPDDPVIEFFTVRAQNLGDANVVGWEFNWQHMLGHSGFGSIVNATLVSGDVEYDPYQLQNSYALTGLSDSANVVLFYDGHRFRSRLAYNWRDHFLLSLGQPQASSEPTFTEAYGQWDANITYDLNAGVSLSFEGLNLTQATVRRHGRFSNQLVALEQYGARYVVGVNARF